MLYKRDELFTLVEQFVGLAFHENRHVSSRRQEDLPVIMVAGDRGMGKTAVLQEIARAYGNRAPLVLLDLARDQYSEAWRESRPGDAPLLRMLSDLKWGLEKRVELNGPRLAFPRLSLALLAITTWQPDSRITLQQARQRLTDAQDSVAKIAHTDRKDRDDWANDWIKDVLSDFSGSAVPFPVNVFLKATVRAFLTKTLSRFNREGPLNWHKEYARDQPGDGYEALIGLGENFHLGGDYRPAVERALVASFLADLDFGYRGIAKASRAAFPLVLLDNVQQNPVGAQFLRLVLSCRTRANPDRLVVVAAGPDNAAAQVTGAGQPESRLRQARLTRLTRSDVLKMLSDADPAMLPPGLAQLIHRLTDGLPLGVDAVTRAVTAAAPANRPDSARTPVSVSSMLDLHVPVPGKPGQRAVDYILEQLIPDSTWRPRLITLVPALNQEEAEALVTAYLATGRYLLTVNAEELLTANGWHRDPEPFVGDPFLRTLLLHQLNARTAAPTRTAVHTTLRNHYGDPGTDTLSAAEPGKLYHCLALGEAAHVVQRLHDSFAGSHPGSWLDALYRISRAPHGRDPDQRRAVAIGDVGGPGRDDTYRSVNRLLHAAWFLADPLVAPDREVAAKITDELKFLATQHPAGPRILSQAARAPHEWEYGWRQQGDSPTRGD